MRRLLGACALLALAACSPHSTTTTASATASPAGGNVFGYVDRDALLKKHPLYGQLARYDRSIEALNLTAIPDAPTKTAAELQAADADLNRQLHDAEERTKKLLKDKQDEYTKRENAAIAAALRGAGAASGPGAAQIAAGVNAQTQAQVAGVAAQAQKDFEAYRKTLIAQDQAAVDALTKTANERAARAYRTKVEELTAKESAFSFELANKDSAQRLALRTKLSNLALDDAQREEMRKELAALDRSEADQIAAMRNRDQQTLAAYQQQLRAQSQKDLETQARTIHDQTVAKLRTREQQARTQLAQAAPPAPVALASGGPALPANVPADLRSKIQSLHQDYEKQYKHDADEAIAGFQKTRSELQRRFNELHGVDTDAQASAKKEIANLQKQRDDLYKQMLAQIDREVQVVAHNRGINVVLTDVAAAQGGVDLTPDAQKEIESLHE